MNLLESKLSCNKFPFGYLTCCKFPWKHNLKIRHHCGFSRWCRHSHLTLRACASAVGAATGRASALGRLHRRCPGHSRPYLSTQVRSTVMLNHFNPTKKRENNFGSASVLLKYPRPFRHYHHDDSILSCLTRFSDLL